MAMQEDEDAVLDTDEELVAEEEATTSLEERRFELEVEVRRREIKVKEDELRPNRDSFTMPQAAVVGTLLTLIGGGIGAFFTHAAQMENTAAPVVVGGPRGYNEEVSLERLKSRDSFVLAAINSSSATDTVRN